MKIKHCWRKWPHEKRNIENNNNEMTMAKEEKSKKYREESGNQSAQQKRRSEEIIIEMTKINEISGEESEEVSAGEKSAAMKSGGIEEKCQ